MSKPRKFTYTWTIKPHSGSFAYRADVVRSDGAQHLTFGDTVWGTKRAIQRYVRRSERAARNVMRIEGTS